MVASADSVLRDPRAVRRIAIVGAGVIGSGWAAHFLARGYDVVAQDVDPGAEARLHRFVDLAWPTVAALGLAAQASRDRLTFTASLETALADADFVQECGPEDLALKQALYRQMDTLASPDIVIASSTSGILLSDLQGGCRWAGRMVVGHPFNPPYLVPLVEVVGGRATRAETMDWAMQLYRLAGKRPLRLDRELPGFLANRLQEAVWREVLHLVDRGEATVEQIDAAIRDGPGLRWAFMGPCLTFHLAGGEGGIRQMLEHFAHTLSEPWCRMDAPALTEGLIDRMDEGCRRVAGARSLAALIRERDESLVRILRALGRLPADDAAPSALAT